VPSSARRCRRGSRRRRGSRVCGPGRPGRTRGRSSPRSSGRPGGQPRIAPGGCGSRRSSRTCWRR
jgi:hypothetical protein